MFTLALPTFPTDTSTEPLAVIDTAHNFETAQDVAIREANARRTPILFWESTHERGPMYRATPAHTAPVGVAPETYVFGVYRRVVGMNDRLVRVYADKHAANVYADETQAAWRDFTGILYYVSKMPLL